MNSKAKSSRASVVSMIRKILGLALMAVLVLHFPSSREPTKIFVDAIQYQGQNFTSAIATTSVDVEFIADNCYFFESVHIVDAKTIRIDRCTFLSTLMISTTSSSLNNSLQVIISASSMYNRLTLASFIGSISDSSKSGKWFSATIHLSEVDAFESIALVEQLCNSTLLVENVTISQKLLLGAQIENSTISLLSTTIQGNVEGVTSLSKVEYSRSVSSSAGHYWYQYYITNSTWRINSCQIDGGFAQEVRQTLRTVVPGLYHYFRFALQDSVMDITDTTVSGSTKLYLWGSQMQLNDRVSFDTLEVHGPADLIYSIQCRLSVRALTLHSADAGRLFSVNTPMADYSLLKSVVFSGTLNSVEWSDLQLNSFDLSLNVQPDFSISFNNVSMIGEAKFVVNGEIRSSQIAFQSCNFSAKLQISELNLKSSSILVINNTQLGSLVLNPINVNHSTLLVSHVRVGSDVELTGLFEFVGLSLVHCELLSNFKFGGKFVNTSFVFAHNQIAGRIEGMAAPHREVYRSTVSSSAEHYWYQYYITNSTWRINSCQIDGGFAQEVRQTLRTVVPGLYHYFRFALQDSVMDITDTTVSGSTKLYLWGSQMQLNDRVSFDTLEVHGPADLIYSSQCRLSVRALTLHSADAERLFSVNTPMADYSLLKSVVFSGTLNSVEWSDLQLNSFDFSLSVPSTGFVVSLQNISVANEAKFLLNGDLNSVKLIFDNCTFSQTLQLPQLNLKRSSILSINNTRLASLILNPINLHNSTLLVSHVHLDSDVELTGLFEFSGLSFAQCELLSNFKFGGKFVNTSFCFTGNRIRGRFEGMAAPHRVEYSRFVSSSAGHYWYQYYITNSTWRINSCQIDGGFAQEVRQTLRTVVPGLYHYFRFALQDSVMDITDTTVSGSTKLYLWGSQMQLNDRVSFDTLEVHGPADLIYSSQCRLYVRALTLHSADAGRLFSVNTPMADYSLLKSVIFSGTLNSLEWSDLQLNSFDLSLNVPSRGVYISIINTSFSGSAVFKLVGSTAECSLRLQNVSIAGALQFLGLNLFGNSLIEVILSKISGSLELTDSVITNSSIQIVSTVITQNILWSGRSSHASFSLNSGSSFLNFLFGLQAANTSFCFRKATMKGSFGPTPSGSRIGVRQQIGSSSHSYWYQFHAVECSWTVEDSSLASFSPYLRLHLRKEIPGLFHYYNIYFFSNVFYVKDGSLGGGTIPFASTSIVEVFGSISCSGTTFATQCALLNKSTSWNCEASNAAALPFVNDSERVTSWPRRRACVDVTPPAHPPSSFQQVMFSLECPDADLLLDKMRKMASSTTKTVSLLSTPTKTATLLPRSRSETLVILPVRRSITLTSVDVKSSVPSTRKVATYSISTPNNDHSIVNESHTISDERQGNCSYIAATRTKSQTLVLSEQAALEKMSRVMKDTVTTAMGTTLLMGFSVSATEGMEDMQGLVMISSLACNQPAIRDAASQNEYLVSPFEYSDWRSLAAIYLLILVIGFGVVHFIITAALFGLFHGTPNKLFSTFILAKDTLMFPGLTYKVWALVYQGVVSEAAAAVFESSKVDRLVGGVILGFSMIVPFAVYGFVKKKITVKYESFDFIFAKAHLFFRANILPRGYWLRKDPVYGSLGSIFSSVRGPQNAFALNLPFIKAFGIAIFMSVGWSCKISAMVLLVFHGVLIVATILLNQQNLGISMWFGVLFNFISSLLLASILVPSAFGSITAILFVAAAIVSFLTTGVAVVFTVFSKCGRWSKRERGMKSARIHHEEKGDDDDDDENDNDTLQNPLLIQPMLEGDENEVEMNPLTNEKHGK